MHSRIFQISDYPIEKDDYISESDYYYGHWFIGEVADYVSNDVNRTEDIKWIGANPGIEVDAGKNTIKVVSKDDFFRGSHQAFKTLAKKISDTSLDDFTKLEDLDMDMYRLRKLYEDKYGFYIQSDDCLVTFDAWVRAADENVDYYIGGIVDYHC